MKPTARPLLHSVGVDNKVYSVKKTFQSSRFKVHYLLSEPCSASQTSIETADGGTVVLVTRILFRQTEQRR